MCGALGCVAIGDCELTNDELINTVPIKDVVERGLPPCLNGGMGNGLIHPTR